IGPGSQGPISAVGSGPTDHTLQGRRLRPHGLPPHSGYHRRLDHTHRNGLMTRTSTLPLSWLLLCALLLTACSGGGVRKRVFPPSASVQEVVVEADGRWRLALRLQNFSNVPHRFTGFSA